MKKLLKIGIVSLVFLGGCKTTQKTVIKEQKDSIVQVKNYELRIKTDSIFIVQTDTVNNTIEIPCDSSYFQQNFSNGKSNFIIKKEKGSVVIKYKQNPINDKLRITNYELYKKNDSLSKLRVTNYELREKVIKKTFWQEVMLNIWKILFFVVLILWVFGLTPKWIISKII